MLQEVPSSIWCQAGEEVFRSFLQWPPQYPLHTLLCTIEPTLLRFDSGWKTKVVCFCALNEEGYIKAIICQRKCDCEYSALIKWTAFNSTFISGRQQAEIMLEQGIKVELCVSLRQNKMFACNFALAPFRPVFDKCTWSHYVLYE